MDQLRGKTIAVSALHGLAELLTANVLTSHEVPGSSVHFVVVPFPAMGAALAAHRVDAAFMTEPFLSAAEVGHGVVPVSGIDRGAAQDVPIAGYVTTREWAAMYPRTAASFVRALSGASRSRRPARLRSSRPLSGRCTSAGHGRGDGAGFLPADHDRQ